MITSPGSLAAAFFALLLVPDASSAPSPYRQSGSPARYAEALVLAGTLPPPLTVRSADIDGDGQLDLVVLTAASPPPLGPGTQTDTYLLRGLGGLRFGVPEVLIPARGARSMDVADIDSDGDPDVALALVNGLNDVEVWANDGSGSFRLEGDASLTSSITTEVEVLDVDGDGLLDVALYGSTGDGQLGFFGVDWVRQTSAGAFAPGGDLASDLGRTSRTRLVDIDGDGDLDVIATRAQSVTSSEIERLTWFENTSGFPITAPGEPLIPTGDTFATDFCVLDYDLDGDLDVAVLLPPSPQADTRIRIVEQVSPGSFALAATVGAPDDAEQLSAADLDGDGSSDLVLLAETAGVRRGPFYLLNNGAGAFGGLQQVDSAPLRTSAVLAADLSGDGLPELVALELPPTLFGPSVLASSGARLYGNVSTPGSTGASFESPRDLSEAFGRAPVLLGDVNQDGEQDLIVHRVGEANYVAVKLGEGGGAFGQARRIADMAPFTETLQQGAAVGDVSGDGALDLVFVSPGGAGVAAILGDGTGQFSSPAPLPGWPLDTDFVRLFDLDADGDLDVIGVHAAGTVILTGLNQGAGVFAAPTAVGAPTQGSLQLEAFDADGDGQLDLTVIAGDRVERALGLGGGQFAPRALIATLPWAAASSALGDFNADGLLDIASLERDPGAFQTPDYALFPGLPGGLFGSTPTLLTAPASWDILQAFDVNMDGAADLYLHSSAGGFQTSLLLSNGDLTFRAPEALPVDLRSLSTLLPAGPDLDADGDVELIAGGTLSGELLVLVNETIAVQGQAFCPFATPNSTGATGRLEAFGASEIFLQRMELTATRLPQNTLGYFLTSRTQDFQLDVPGSVGVLCLGGAIGRFVGSGQVLDSGPQGSFSLSLDLSALPQPSGPVAALAGQSWSFQAWHRDTQTSGQATSNFTEGVELTFR